MFERVRRDLKRYFVIESRTGTPTLLEKVKILAESHGLQALFVYRFGSWINRSVSQPMLRLPLKVVYLSLHETMNALYGIYIHGDADIEGGLFIPHPHGVMIGAVKMGEDCCVSQNATIGVRPGVGHDAPMLGNRVWIGPGAVLFGQIKIADGASIGALTVVGRNLPPRCLASGNPMQIIKRNFDNSSLLYGDRLPAASATVAAAAPGAALAKTDAANAGTAGTPPLKSVGEAPR
jgi:serine O-acetyltransferase